MIIVHVRQVLTVVECYSIVPVRFCGKTISYVIKRIEMIADALVAGTKLMKSQFVTFAAHPLWCSTNFPNGV